MAYNNPRGQSRDREDSQFDLSLFKQKQKEWIQKEFTPDTLRFAEQFGEHLVKNRLTTSQIRNIYGEVKRIEAKADSDLSGKTYKDFLLLKPKIAYAAKRAGSRGIEIFKEVMDLAHTSVVEVEKGSKQKEAFQNFTDFFEAILAYHKAYGGRE